MDKAMTLDGRLIHARRAFKGSPYRCPSCGSDVILALGKVNKDHFRHRSAKTRQEVLRCENYVSQLGIEIEDSGDIYENEMQIRSQMRLKLAANDGVWKLYLRFPMIKTEFHSIIDREQLYFKVSCEEEQHEFSSIHLLSFTAATGSVNSFV